MKILVFGGSFDPPHKGHAALLAAAARRVDPDWILIVPAWRSPLKTRWPAMPEDRLAMIRLGLLQLVPGHWRKRAWIHTEELEKGRPVYTVDTLAGLAHDHPDAELHFALGWDAAVQFRQWKDPARLKTLARWWTVRRPGAAGEPPSFFHRLKASMPEASSSDVRARLAVGDDVHGVAEPVLAYIHKRGLYGLERLRRLRGMLGAERYEHSRSVARLSRELARRWDEDEDRALAAGILHDCGRSIPVPRMAAYARRRKLSIAHRERAGRMQPLALHAHISEDVCRRRFGVDDPAVLSAVRKHTLGDATMTLLDKILYVADACSEDRTHAEAAALRTLAFEDIDEALKGCVRNKLRWCLEAGGWVHPMTLAVWNSLVD